MSKSYGKDLTVGNIPKTLAAFAVPIFLANLLSAGYNIINTIWVGRLIGGNAVGAVAVTFPIVLFMVAVCSGAATASTVLTAHYFGARQHEKVQRVADTSWTVAGILVTALTLAGVLLTNPLLALLGTPSEILPLASGYLRLTVCGFGFLYVSFLFMATLRAIGDAKRPMGFVVLGTALNALLDPLLIRGAGPFPCLGLNGAAVASLVAGGTSLLAGLVYFKIRYGHSPVYPRRIALDRALAGKIFQIGFPQFMQQSLFSFTVGILTMLVNGFGPVATAAFGIAGRIDGLVGIPAMAVMAAVSTVTAQNLGANKPDQVHLVFRSGLLINAPAILVLSMVSVLFPAAIMRLFVKDAEIISLGAGYLRIVGWGYVFLILPYVSNGIIVGSGKTMITMFLSLVSLCLVRIPLALWLSRTSLGLTGVWAATALSFSVNAGLGYLYYLSGKWKNTALIQAPASAVLTSSPAE